MIHVLGVGNGTGSGRLDDLARNLSAVFRVRCQVREDSLDPGFAWDVSRAQYHSTKILERMVALPSGDCSRMIGIADVDFFVPIFTFVFGEAQLDGHCAVVSTYRLAEEHYGLPPNEAKLGERLLKEAVHELGHTFGLHHCDNWQCVMASSHSVERLDLKSAEFCDECAEIVRAECVSLGR
jgi:archaemetzincin